MTKRVQKPDRKQVFLLVIGLYDFGDDGFLTMTYLSMTMFFHDPSDNAPKRSCFGTHDIHLSLTPISF